MRNIVSPLDGFLSPFGRRSGVIDPFSLLMSTLLSGSSQVIAHPLAYGIMFQDRTGTTPVTAPGQLVGMVLDHGFTGSKPVPGSERYTDDDAKWTLDTGVTVSGGVLTFTGAEGFSANSYADSETVVTPGKTYIVEVEVLTRTAGSLEVRIGASGIVDLTGMDSPGVYTARLQCTVTSANLVVQLFGRSSFVGSARVISIRELPGYHATAISDAARGVYREEGGIRYIEYNGVNTAYSTPALPAPLVDKTQVFAGVRKLSDAAQGIVSELSPSIATNNGDFALSAPNSAADNLAFESKGTTLQSAIASGYVSPITNVLTGLGDISGDLAALRIDGTQVGQNIADQGTGNYNPSGTYPLYYGARAGTSLFFNGRHYDTLGPITRFSATNATTEQIEAAEAYYTARVI